MEVEPEGVEVIITWVPRVDVSPLLPATEEDVSVVLPVEQVRTGLSPLYARVRVSASVLRDRRWTAAMLKATDAEARGVLVDLAECICGRDVGTDRDDGVDYPAEVSDAVAEAASLGRAMWLS